MKPRTCLATLILSLVNVPVLAYERYTEARITQIETSETAIFVFLQVVSGDAPPTGNGGSNEPAIKPYLVLANSVEDLAARKHYQAAALVAMTNGTVVRFRWDDAGPNANRVMVMLVRG
jgi:hypothetical protein